MSMHEDIELRVQRAFAVAPSEVGLRRLDERVAEIVARPPSTRRGALLRRRAFVRPLALAATFALLTGTVGATMSLIDRLAQTSSVPGGPTAWERAEIVGIEQTDAGVTITLERAYADVNQVLLGFTVEGLDAPPSSEEAGPEVTWTAELRDPTGRTDYEWAPSVGGAGAVEADTGAVLMTWLGAPPPLAGTWEVTVTSVGYGGGDGFVPGICTDGATEPECVDPFAAASVEGAWRFTFDLPAPAGTSVSPDVSDTVGPATVTLTGLRIAPTTTSVRLALRESGR